MTINSRSSQISLLPTGGFKRCRLSSIHFLKLRVESRPTNTSRSQHLTKTMLRETKFRKRGVPSDEFSCGNSPKTSRCKSTEGKCGSGINQISFICTKGGSDGTEDGIFQKTSQIRTAKSACSRVFRPLWRKRLNSTDLDCKSLIRNGFRFAPLHSPALKAALY